MKRFISIIFLALSTLLSAQDTTVPIALPITFSKVCEVVYEDFAGTNGRSLSGVFAQAITQGGTFDPTYSDSKDRLTNFRGYEVAAPPTPTYVDNGGLTANIGQSVNVNYPSTNNNDILLMIVYDELDNLVLSVSGWSEIVSGSVVGSEAWKWFWRRSDGTETGSVNVSSLTDEGLLMAGIMYRFSGCVTTGLPYENSIVDVESNNTVFNNVILDNSLGDNRLAVGIFSFSGDLYSSMTLNGWSEIDNSVTLTGNDATFVLTTKEIITSGTSAGTVTLNTLSITNCFISAIYLKPN